MKLKHEIIHLNNEKIVVVDNFLNKYKLAKILKQLDTKKFGRYLTTSYNGKNGYTWMLNLKANQQFTFLDELLSLITKTFKQGPQLICRTYIHYLQFADMSQPHEDCKRHEDDLTVVLYLNPKWELNWGGELLFYDHNQARVALTPKPGRLVIFPGKLIHAASTPNSIAPEPRLSWIFKLTTNKRKKALFDRDLAKWDNLFDYIET